MIVTSLTKCTPTGGCSAVPIEYHLQTMLFNWLNAREAAEAGVSLADAFYLQTTTSPAGKGQPGGLDAQRKNYQQFLQKFLQSIDREARTLQLNVFKRAKLANSFKWRLLEKGVARELVDELTEALLVRLATAPSTPETAQPSTARPGHRSSAAGSRPRTGKVATLLAQANERLAQGDYAAAAGHYQELLALDSRHTVARNNLGAALARLGRYREAEDEFRRAIGIKDSNADAHGNLGAVLQWRGQIAASETSLRRALKLKPLYPDAQINLGTTLVRLGRLADARATFEKATRPAPGNAHAWVGLGQIEALEGRFAEAETAFKRALEIEPNAAMAWAGLVALRKMTAADTEWLRGAEQAAASGLAPVEEATIRYAIGKYYDDLGEFGRAFRSYQRGNELNKALAEPYDRAARERFVDDLVRVWTRETLAGMQAGASDSIRPVLVVGMARSGTTLVEQIVASHPSVKGAGELDFWTVAVREHESLVRREPLNESLRAKLAARYLSTLSSRYPDAARVVDKATANSDYLGIIHSVFPRARIIYVQRNPIDTCLSCYFQQLSPALNSTMDLEDLAHYYREHRRLIDHWRSVLPAEALLTVPYEELTADQERWTRRMLEFLGLEWDPRCLDFHQTTRPVLTSSYWQVRQRVYRGSVERWRNYRQFIGPLLPLADS